MDLGPRVNAELRNINSPPAEVKVFRTKCLNFLTKLRNQIYQRFPFRSAEIDILQYVSFVDPINLVDIKSISSLSSFLGLDVVEVDRQYKDFRMFKTDPSIDDPESF